jgi:hypothetical protein
VHASHAKLTGDKIFTAWQSLTIETTQANGERQMTIAATLFIFGVCFAPLVAIIIGNIICDN